MKRTAEHVVTDPSRGEASTSPIHNSVSVSRRPSKRRKAYIPKSLRIAVWDKNIGLKIGTTLCTVCKIGSITQMDFQCGHIIAEAEGGETCLSNLIPVCTKCNLSMGRKNLNDFKQMYFK